MLTGPFSSLTLSSVISRTSAASVVLMSSTSRSTWQADRSPTHMYRTAPLAGLWSHQKGGFYHDGRFANLPDVIEHYDGFFNLRLSEQEKRDLNEYLKSL
jgi:hypothetical protein